MILRMLLAAAVVIATEPCPASVSSPTGSGRAEGTYLKTVNAASTASRGRTSQSEGGRGHFDAATSLPVKRITVNVYVHCHGWRLSPSSELGAATRA